jgi:sporulation protein YtfJ
LEHPIQGLMKTAMENLKEMVDVNKIVGDAVETPDGQVIIPVSRVSFGYVSGGTEFDTAAEEYASDKNTFPFGGGSGGGVSLRPVAFLVAAPGEIRVIPVDRGDILDRLVDLAPQVINYIHGMLEPDSEG